MATYAAYRHIELDNVGYGKKRVLKPPGGGSSDIFGTNGGGGGASETPSGPGGVRRVKNHFASNLFLSDEQPSQGVGAAPSKTPESNGDAHDGGVIETKSNGSVASMNGTATPAMNGNVKPMTNGSATTAAANGNGPATPKQRVPPGGYSSGLW